MVSLKDSSVGISEPYRGSFFRGFTSSLAVPLNVAWLSTVEAGPWLSLLLSFAFFSDMSNFVAVETLNFFDVLFLGGLHVGNRLQAFSGRYLKERKGFQDARFRLFLGHCCRFANVFSRS